MTSLIDDLFFLSDNLVKKVTEEAVSRDIKQITDDFIVSVAEKDESIKDHLLKTMIVSRTCLKIMDMIPIPPWKY